jgi:ABC-type transport system involved in multi-copper enzyme maturation permease subunit
VLIGPVFTREALTAPRRPQLFVARALCVAVLLGLALTAWQVLVGSGELRGPGDLSRFGGAAFALLGPLVLTVAVLFSGLLAAASVSQEKSRGTLLLLLVTDLTSRELVLGRLLASLVTIGAACLAVVPFFLLLALVGGIEHARVGWAILVTVAGSLVAGSVGSLFALWREKPFPALALTALSLVLWLAAGEVIASGVLGPELLGVPAADAAALVSPWRAVAQATGGAVGGAPPTFADEVANRVSKGLAPRWAEPAVGFAVFAAVAVVAINALAIAMVRVWNPSRETQPASAATRLSPEAAPRDHAAAVDGVGIARGQTAEVHRIAGEARQVWDNPVLWREVRTWAYGKRVLVVKVAYLVIFAVCAAAVVKAAPVGGPASREPIHPAAAPMAPLLVVSLVLVNALAVTSLTGERDGKSLDLLLATDLTPRELLGGKLGGAFWNAREMILLPIALCGYLAYAGALDAWLLFLVVACLLILNAYAATLGLHAAMIYDSSRRAIGVSIGALLFLFLGVSICMRMMLALSDSFENQLASFLGFVAGGGVALFAALAWRNPSTAMGLATISAPLAVFYAITSFLLGDYSLVALAVALSFGFAVAAMLVPALSEFDIATGAAPTKE